MAESSSTAQVDAQQQKALKKAEAHLLVAAAMAKKTPQPETQKLFHQHRATARMLLTYASEIDRAWQTVEADFHALGLAGINCFPAPFHLTDLLLRLLKSSHTDAELRWFMRQIYVDNPYILALLLGQPTDDISPLVPDIDITTRAWLDTNAPRWVYALWPEDCKERIRTLYHSEPFVNFRALYAEAAPRDNDVWAQELMSRLYYMSHLGEDTV